LGSERGVRTEVLADSITENRLALKTAL
jgi:hypothetical protein